MTQSNASNHAYLSDDDISISEDDEDGDEVRAKKKDFNLPQIAIKCSVQQILQKTVREKEEDTVDNPQPLDYELVRKLINGYMEVRAEHEAETEKYAEKEFEEARQQTRRYQIRGGGKPTPLNLEPLSVEPGQECAELLNENGEIIQRVPVQTLEPVKRKPPMSYFTYTGVNVKTDDDYSLSHVPYLDDLSQKEYDQWYEQLMEAFPDGVHGAKVGLMEGAFINDYILYAMVKRVLDVGEDGTIDDAELRHVMYQVHAMFLSKGSVNKFVSSFPDLRARFEPAAVKRPVMQNDEGELLANFTPSRLLNSFDVLLCHRCMRYDCTEHGSEVNTPPGWRPEKRGESKPEVEKNKKPCSDDCYLNAPAKREPSGWGVMSKLAKMFQSTSSSKGTATSTTTFTAGTNSSAQDLSMWDKSDFNQPSHVAGWTPHEEACFNLVCDSAGGDFCRLSEILKTLNVEGTPKKTCREVYEYARRTGRLHPKTSQENVCTPGSPPRKLKKIPAWKADHGFRKTQWANNGGKMDNRHMYVPCRHEGKCSEENGCQCAAVGNVCTKFCACSKEDCRRRFPGCRCTPGNCRTKACNCYYASWECDPDVCKRCNCDKVDDANEPSCKNVCIQRGYQKKLIIAPSQVAGWGAYAADEIERNDFICEYTGEVISHGESERRGRIYDKLKCSYLFRLNTSQDVDATRMGNLARFINHSMEPNCRASVMVVNGDHKIGIFAKHPIKQYEELFFNYAYNKSQQMEFVPLELPKHMGKPVEHKSKKDKSYQQRNRADTLVKKRTRKRKSKLRKWNCDNSTQEMKFNKLKRHKKPYVADLVVEQSTQAIRMRKPKKKGSMVKGDHACISRSQQEEFMPSHHKPAQSLIVPQREKDEEDWLEFEDDWSDPDVPSTSSGILKKRY